MKQVEITLRISKRPMKHTGNFSKLSVAYAKVFSKEENLSKVKKLKEPLGN